MEDIRLGDIAKDKISGFKGMVTAVTTWLNGCRRFALTPQELTKEGKPAEGQWFDDVQVVLIKAGQRAKPRPAGGPKPTPERQRDPT